MMKKKFDYIYKLKIICIFAAEPERKSLGKVSLNSQLTMARMQGITGKLSGKMGAAVFRVREGQQIVTQYNPIVKNPNTQGQQDQRAKFKLMSQLSAIMAPALGTLGTINRPARGKETQRNAFTRLNMALVEVTTQSNQVTAKIPMEEVKLTSSFRDLPPISLTPLADGMDVDINGISTDVTTIRLVVVGYKGNVASLITMIDAPVDSESHNVTTSIGNLSTGKYTVLAYGLIPSETAKASIDIDNIHTPEDEAFISAVKLNAMVTEGSMAVTKTMGANVTLNV